MHYLNYLYKVASINELLAKQQIWPDICLIKFWPVLYLHFPLLICYHTVVALCADSLRCDEVVTSAAKSTAIQLQTSIS